MSFISGPYAWTFGGRPLGTLEVAADVNIRKLGRPIVADAFGGQQIDHIQVGLTGTIDMIFQEADAPGVELLLATFSGGKFGQLGKLGCPGLEASANVLCGERLSIAECASPAVVIAYRAAIPPDYDIRMLFGSELRNVPIRFQLYPYERSIGSGTLQVVEFLDGKPADVTKAAALGMPAYLQTIGASTGTTDTMTALGLSTLYSGQLFNVSDTYYVWDPTATSGLFEPDDKTNPGSDPGYWVAYTG